MTDAVPGGSEVSAMRLFPHFLFRTTGFPVEQLDRLACSRSLELANQILEKEIWLERFAEQFLETVGREVREGAVRPALVSAARHVRRRRAVDAESLEALRAAGFDGEAAALTDFNVAVGQIQCGMSCGETVLKEELAASQAAIEELTRDERFREAVLLSAPSALEGFERIVPGSKPRRQILRKALLYLQRFCSKNDTISFFGPITWGRFDHKGASNLDLTWRGEALSSRQVFFEHWGAAQLAVAMEEDAELAEQLVWRLRYPYAWSARNGLVRSLHIGMMQCRLEPASACVLAAIHEAHESPDSDPKPSAREILDRLSESRGVPRQSLVEGFQALRKAGIIGALTVPIETLRPVEELRGALARISPDHLARIRWESRLTSLLDLTKRFESASYALRRELFPEIEARFAEWTGKESRRNGGRTYGARNLIYEDCTRDPECFTIGGTLRADLESDLREVLDVQSALFDVVMPYGWQRLEKIHQDLSRGGRPVRLSLFMSKLRGSVASSYLDAHLVLSADQEGLLEKARGVLDLRRNERGDLSVAARHPSSGGPPLLRYPIVLAADMMIAARDVQALESGDYELVIGEFQYFALGYPEFALSFHPQPELFAADYRKWMAAPRRTALPLVRVELEPEVSRLLRIGKPLADYTLVDVHARPFDPARPQRAITELTVVLEDGRILVEDRAGERFLLGNPFYDLFLDAGWKLLVELHRRENATREMPAQMVIGRRTVILRRDWLLEGANLAPPRGKPGWGQAPFAAFVGVQRLRRRRGLPRYAFARFTDEIKPVLVDFDNPLFLENLAHMTPPDQTVRLSEMRPSRDELWMTSARGSHTSELRVFLA